MLVASCGPLCRWIHLVLACPGRCAIPGYFYAPAVLGCLVGDGLDGLDGLSHIAESFYTLWELVKGRFIAIFSISSIDSGKTTCIAQGLRKGDIPISYMLWMCKGTSGHGRTNTLNLAATGPKG